MKKGKSPKSLQKKNDSSFWSINMDQRKKDLLKEIETFEAVFPDGVYAVPPKQGQPRIKVRNV
ncbi:hypothetical protein [Fictibacillus terranigra]|uniref:Uncharacterized protein n=1 Tax=Fictibacillus terranigra TaxID=3058424 RepID=A0ABT8E559_9BACL|nr:hypothetical protein [Fictibacillus sp. CENA-BCM004]MDN4073047.1 hypothetical protein [Fictibacillus sp. CENA-BCM004]